MKLFPGALFPLYISRAVIKAYIRQSRCLFLVRPILSLPFRLTLFFPSAFHLSFSLSLFVWGFHWGDLITVAYRKGRFCTHVTGNTSLTPSIKVNGLVTGMSFFMARPYAKDMILSAVPLLEHVGHDQWPRLCGSALQECSLERILSRDERYNHQGKAKWSILLFKRLGLIIRNNNYSIVN